MFCRGQRTRVGIRADNAVHNLLDIESLSYVTITKGPGEYDMVFVEEYDLLD